MSEAVTMPRPGFTLFLLPGYYSGTSGKVGGHVKLLGRVFHGSACEL